MKRGEMVKKALNICFYISDYGYGHASRDIAIIRRFLSEDDDVRIHIKTDKPFHFVRQSLLQKNVEVIQTRNDIGIVFKRNSVNVDRERTKKTLDKWLSLWDEYIQNEKRFCETHEVDLILSDIVPQPFIIADELNIPSIAISNFTWHYIFYNLFGDIPATERIKEAYQRADVALVLPFNEEMNIFKEKREISLVSREITVDRHVMRRKCGISDDELLVYVGVGLSLNPSYLSRMKNIDKPNVNFLVSFNAKLPFEKVISIPNNETETQNYIALCNLVVSKPGYGIVSEAIRAKVPMFLLKRDGFKEDELTGNKVEALGIGRFISEKSFLDGDWIDRLNEVKSWGERFDNLPKSFKEDGVQEVISMMVNSNYL
jgi:uncharacterized protein (TIGR00661 family)